MKYSRTVRTPEALAQFLLQFQAREWPEQGYFVEIQDAEQARTGQQNAFLWGVIYPPIAAHLSEQNNRVITKEMVHELCKSECGERITVEIGGRVRTFPRSTSALSKREFNEYIDKVSLYASETLGVVFYE